jgi:hypothetical protein
MTTNRDADCVDAEASEFVNIALIEPGVPGVNDMMNFGTCT